MKRLRALLLPVLGLLTCLPAQATWSIVVIDRRTGEVGITSATCIADLDLSVHLPVVVVGHGAGAAQSAIDTQGRNRREIRQALLAGKTPDEILTWLAATDTSHQSRQYGLVSRTGPAVTFTGTGAGLARFGVTGSVGPYDYAIQGNVLTGDEVVLAAETAFRSTSGDMAERMMAGMEAAMGLGGDGRCSCAPSDPTGCGVPPVGFTHSAYTGFFIVARPGDSDGDCDAITGCVTGQYYGFLNFVGNANTADPVVELRAQFDAWRLGLQGRPDHFQSTWAWTDSGLVADGSDTAALELDLRDLLGQSTNPPDSSCRPSPSPPPP
ncbi:MAG: DUF1028 domain-containing protein [Planctomycetota bacterium]